MVNKWFSVKLLYASYFLNIKVGVSSAECGFSYPSELCQIIALLFWNKAIQLNFAEEMPAHHNKREYYSRKIRESFWRPSTAVSGSGWD